MSDDSKDGLVRGEQLFDSFVRAPETETGQQPGTPPPAAAPDPVKPPPPRSSAPPPNERAASALPPAPVRPAAVMWCTDCRTPLRGHYIAVNDRPVCAKCSDGYRRRMARGGGSSGLMRASLYAFGAALGGATLLGITRVGFGIGSFLCMVAMGWFVGKAINKARDGYYSRRYQVLAVLMTYFGVGLGNVAPAIVAVAYLTKNVRDEVRAEARAAAPTPDPATAAAVTPPDELEGPDEGYIPDHESDEFYPATPEHTPSPTAEPSAADMEAARQATENTRLGSRSYVEEAVQRLGSAGMVGLLGGLLVLIATLPLTSMLSYGIFGAGFGLWALGFGIYKAWTLTGDGETFEIYGPYRIGSGPIAVPR